jgi:phenylpropionate dioxygenase-like ring-hydroxylating dioxygenase large terminal subunit
VVKGSTRFSHLCRRVWYPVSLSAEVGRRPRRVELLGDPYVLYRDAAGSTVAHLDRCPHRNVPLSHGRCLRDNTLECPYHGWRFSPDGACVSIPGKEGAPKPSHRVETFPTREQYGFVWMLPDEKNTANVDAPLKIPEADDKSYTTFVRRVEYPGGLHAVIENALDVPHTGVLHRGLFRSDNARKPVEVELRRYATWTEAQYLGENAPRGILGRLLTLGSKKSLRDIQLEHWDRFVLPSALQVEYRIGPRSHFLITGFCCPKNEHSTELFALVCLRTPLPRFLEKLLVRLIEPFAWKVVAQDVRVLGAQAKTIAHFEGERFMSTEIDVLGSSITRLLKEAWERENSESGEPLSTSELVRPESPREMTRLKILV